MKIRLALIFVLLLPLIGIGQNLVPNGSFEEYVNCPETVGNLSDCEQWFSAQNSCDYYHTCGSDLLSPPSTIFGFQEPYAGEAYGALATYSNTVDNHREVLGVELIMPLTIGEEYFFSMQVSRSVFDQATLASNGIGVLMSSGSFAESGEIYPSMVEAQIQEIALLADTLNWMQIAGSFVADSAYTHLLIGAFLSDQEMLLDPPYEESAAYYFIDDVRLSADSIWVYTSIGERILIEDVRILGNPITSELRIHVSDFVNEVILFDANGRLCYQKMVRRSGVILIDVRDNLPGMYLVYLRTEDGRTISKRVVKQSM